MKNIPLILTCLIVVGAVALDIWDRHATLAKMTAAQTAHAAQMKPPPRLSLADQWQEFNEAPVKTLQTNPDLAAEYKEISGEIAAQEKAVNAAVIKIDPTAASIIAKVENIRHNQLPMPVSAK